MERLEQAAEGVVMTSSIAKGAPVAAGGIVSGLDFFGYSVPDLVPFLTAIYLVIMILHMLWKWGAEWRYERRREKEEIKQ